MHGDDGVKVKFDALGRADWGRVGGGRRRRDSVSLPGERGILSHPRHRRCDWGGR